MKLRNNGRRCVRRRNPHTPMLLSSAVVFGTGGPWAAVAYLGNISSCSNIGLATVACRGSNSSSNTGLATVACHGSSSSSNTGIAVVTCRGSSSNSSNGLAAVVSRIHINVAPILFLPPGRRDSSNRCSNRHGESLRSEVAERTEVAPFLKLISPVMAGLLRSGFSRKIWRCRCSPCWRDRSSRRRRQWHVSRTVWRCRCSPCRRDRSSRRRWYLLRQHLRLKR